MQQSISTWMNEQYLWEKWSDGDSRSTMQENANFYSQGLRPYFLHFFYMRLRLSLFVGHKER